MTQRLTNRELKAALEAVERQLTEALLGDHQPTDKEALESLSHKLTQRLAKKGGAR